MERRWKLNNEYLFREISYKEAIDFILPRHYSGRKPQVKYAFGLFYGEKIVSVCTFGIPASASLCAGVCGKEYRHRVLELNRLLSINEDENYPLSKFVSKCLRSLKKHGDLIIVSYSDTEMNHNGYIYQACNFKYTGCTKQRTDKYTEGNKHSRHYCKNSVSDKRKIRSAKHRYIYFISKDKRFIESLKYELLPYPKGDNKNYILGDFLKPRVIEARKEVKP